MNPHLNSQQMILLAGVAVLVILVLIMAVYLLQKTLGRGLKSDESTLTRVRLEGDAGFALSTVQGVIAALQKLVDTAIPSVPIVSREGGTLVIPGHGRACDQLDVVDYRDMVTIVRDRVRDLMKEGRTLQPVKAASPARGYERRFGSTPGSTSQFIEAIYRSLGGK